MNLPFAKDPNLIKEGTSTSVSSQNLKSSFKSFKEYCFGALLRFPYQSHWAFKLKQSLKRCSLQYGKELFQIWEPYKSGSSFPNRIKCISCCVSKCFDMFLNPVHPFLGFLQPGLKKHVKTSTYWIDKNRSSVNMLFSSTKQVS